jgi:hypothetical protein
MNEDRELFAKWQFAAGESGKTPFKTQDELLRRLARLAASGDFLDLARDYYITKRAKYDVQLHAWCGGADGVTLTGLVMDEMAPCEVVEMEMTADAAVCHPAFGRPEHEPLFRAYLRQVTEIASEALEADAMAAKRCAIKSKYAPEPRAVLAPVLAAHSQRYRSFDERSRQLFWKLFETRETDTPWSYFFYNLVLGLDWSPEQMTEAEAAALLLGEAKGPAE